MSELRQNVITQDWVIIATERARRPHEFSQVKEPADIPSHRDNCPFCFGNESDANESHPTEKEIYAIADARGWRVRVLPNKFPALSQEGDRVRHAHGIYRSMTGVGYHEVIVEHRRHDLTLALMDVDEVADILRACRDRYATIRQDPRVEAIIIFKNHGEGAGTSLEHPHSQLAATPIVPHQVRARIDEAIRFYDETGECLFCHTVAEELTAGARIVLESQYFVALIPYAALSPFHLWIFPRRHTSSFEDISEEEIPDLAYNLKTVLAKLYYGLNNPDYNYTIRSIPTSSRETAYFHWYIAIVPRVSKTAGFEIGSGMYINTALPEESAQFLRDVNITGARIERFAEQ